MQLLGFLAFLISICFAHAFLIGTETCSDLREINLTTIRLPDRWARYGESWRRSSATKAFQSQTLDTNWRFVRGHRVQGLNATVREVLDWLHSIDCLFVAWGGCVRDAVLGRFPTDVDGAVSCSPDVLRTACNQKWGENLCRPPSEHSQKLTVGDPDADEFDELVVEPLDLAPWNTSFGVGSDRLEYSPDTLAYVPSFEENDQGLLLDVTGLALEDVCARTIRIPADFADWDVWAQENSINKLFRYWKLRSKGFRPRSPLLVQFLVREIKRNFSASIFMRFYCHSVLDGTYMERTRLCRYQPRRVHAVRVRRFKRSLAEDFVEDGWSERLATLMRLLDDGRFDP